MRGKYQIVERPRRVVFTWGFADNEDFPPGASTVDVTLDVDGAATQLTLLHTGLPPDQAPKYALAWAKYLAQLATTAPTLARLGPK